MSKLKSTLHGGHCLLEMPTGTGKRVDTHTTGKATRERENRASELTLCCRCAPRTVSLLSLILSFQYADPTMGKLVYCTRTVQEMDKVVEELRRVQSYRTKVINAEIAEQVAKGNAQHNIRSPDILGVCLSSRRNLCIHPTVSKHDNRGKVDALCRNKTASFVREQKASGADIEVCQFFEGYESEGKDATLSGIYSISDLKTLGSAHKWCPYFTSRRLVSVANVVVYNYRQSAHAQGADTHEMAALCFVPVWSSVRCMRSVCCCGTHRIFCMFACSPFVGSAEYLLDPKIAGMVSREISKESVVVFDEGQSRTECETMQNEGNRRAHSLCFPSLRLCSAHNIDNSTCTPLASFSSLPAVDLRAYLSLRLPVVIVIQFASRR